MRIAVISDLETHGGAAVAASRLCAGLAGRGHDVQRIVAHADGVETVVEGAHPWQTTLVGSRFVRIHHGGVRGRFLTPTRHAVHQVRSARSIASVLDSMRPDVINLHNIHFAGWSPAIVAACATRAPTVWTLHDMWSFTGRCAYAYDCRKFERLCDASCPTPHEYPPLPPPLIAPSYLLRRVAYAQAPGVAVVTPSRWLAREAKAGLWRDHRVETIPYGLPISRWACSDAVRAAVRARLGLDDDRLLALVVAADLSDRRKGLNYVLEAFAGDAPSGVTLAFLGHGAEKIADRIQGAVALGFVESEEARAEIFGASDLLLHPAPVDNLPNVVLEAMACGTPTVAFPIGGLPDMVRPGETGWLAEAVGPAPLRSALERAARDLESGVSLRESCRRVAESEYADSVQARRYEALFAELLNANDPARAPQPGT